MLAAQGARYLTDMLTVDVLRAVMDIQDGRCALTGEKFELPPDIEYPVNKSLTTTYTFHHPELMPMLVRVSPHEDWSLDNVALIASALVPFYKHVGGYAGFVRRLENKQQRTTLPTKERVLALLTQ